MKKYSAVSLVVCILLLISLACNLGRPMSATPATDVPVTDLPPVTAIPLSPEPSSTVSPVVVTGETFWAVQAVSDSETADPDLASGAPDVSDCDEAMQPTWAPPPGDQPEILSLTYSSPLRASQVELFYLGDPAGIMSVEVQNSLSGLGQLIYNGEQAASPSGEQCPARLSLPVNLDFEVDLIIVTISTSEKPVQIDAVGITGELPGYVDLPVFWRVPLPGSPLGLAFAPGGLVYVATEPNGLYMYDVEGNQLKKFSAPSEASLGDVASDAFANLIIIDEGYGWLIVFSSEGEQLAVGGQDLFGKAAVSPQDGNLYLLKGYEIQVYTTDTAEFIRQVPLDDLHSYASLAFSPDGSLFTLRDYDWDPTLCQLDPQTGEELDAIPLVLSTVGETVARDLAIDENGNFYILFGMNPAQTAIAMLDSHGNLLRRFGQLASDMESWPEGSFFEPREITVSSDGRFILVADGFGDTSYLTAFLVNEE